MIILIKCKRHGNQEMIIDDEDFPKLEGLNLSINDTSTPNTKYCISTIYGKDKLNKPKYLKKINIHRLIMGLGDYAIDKRIIHHKDYNGLNNCKENLEICDTMYNSQSFRRCLEYNYIYFENDPKRKKKWRGQMTIMGKRKQKRFTTKEEGDAWVRELIGTALGKDIKDE